MESTQQWMFISHQVQMHLNTHSVDEEILRLQISMKNISTVTESKAFQQLVHEWLQENKQHQQYGVNLKF